MFIIIIATIVFILNYNIIVNFSDLSYVPNLKETILQSFLSNSEEIKSSASYSLGSISIGNLEQYLPFILREIDMQPKRQYLLLHSLKEVINNFIKLYYLLVVSTY